MNGMFVQPERQGFQERNVVRHDFFVGEIKLVHDNGIDMVVRQQIIYNKEFKVKV